MLEDDEFFIDLVFFNRLLKSFVIVELKTGELTHQDLGQLQMYVNPTFHVRNESQRFARAFVRFLELSNKGLHYTPADAVCAASELTFGGGCAGSVSPSWFKRILTSSFGST